jgi:hypothetical protein
LKENNKKEWWQEPGAKPVEPMNDKEIEAGLELKDGILAARSEGMPWKSLRMWFPSEYQRLANAILYTR